VRIGMLPGANDVVYFLDAFVHRISACKTKLHDVQRIMIPVGFVIKIEGRVVNQCMSGIEIGGGFLPGGIAKRLPHTRLDKGLINRLMAGAA